VLYRTPPLPPLPTPTSRCPASTRQDPRRWRRPSSPPSPTSSRRGPNGGGPSCATTPTGAGTPRLAHSDSVEVWLLGWTPGQQVPGHDHGAAAGAFTVVDGALVEDQLDPGTWAPRKRTTLPVGSRTSFGPAHAHVLGNRGTEAATSVHAYSPPGLPLRFGLAGAASPAAAELLGAAR
jgi:hypothetical protein